MIIVSQSRKNILNFDNVNLIGIDEDGKIKARLGIDDFLTLGKYKTEKRAKEVLEEIIYMYQKQNDDFYYEDVKKTDIKNYRGYTRQHKDNVYYMPEV